MYNLLLVAHSYLRWLVLVALLFSLFRAYRGWLGAKTFTAFDNTVRHVTATICHLQLVAGLALYGVSPLIHYFWQNYKEAVHERDIRYFAMEHSTTMLVSIMLITLGSVLAKRKANDKDKFKTMAIWYSIGFVLIVASVPWPFSPMAVRPYFR